MIRKSSITLFMIFLFLSVSAQKYPLGMRWGGGVDYEKFYWGFNVSYVGSSLKIFKDANWEYGGLPPDASLNNSDSISTISTPFSNGFGFGLLAGIKLHENLDLYISPTVLFSDKEVQFSYKNSKALVTKDLKASLLDLPLTVKFKSHRRKNYGIYLLAGGKYSYNVVSKKKLDDRNALEEDKLLKLKPGFFSYEAGLGVDIYFEYFKMSPELKWSQSFGNVLDKNDMNAFNTPIDKMLLRSIQFSLIFQ